MASFTVPCPKTASSSFPRVNLPRIATPNVSLPFGSQGCNTRQSVVLKAKAKVNKVTVANSSNSVAVTSANSVVGSSEEKVKPPKETVEGNNVPDPESISAFMAQVSDLVKLVDSRDIVELELKQLGCELTIRKKEALEQPAPQVSYAAIPPPLPHAMYAPPPPPLAPQSAPSTQLAALPAPASSSAPASASNSSHPPMKCPMAGTFYRASAPGAPPFVKVGDKVQKGQVVCIVEAMKLMNEIEADQSGTITEILAEDGKPVSVNMPLLVIAP